MVRGTTPTHTFVLPFDTSAIKSLRVSYAQGGNVLFVKELQDFEANGNEIETRLTQDETFMFDDSELVQIQVAVMTLGGDVARSNIIMTTVGECLDSEVLS